MNWQLVLCFMSATYLQAIYSQDECPMIDTFNGRFSRPCAPKYGRSCVFTCYYPTGTPAYWQPIMSFSVTCNKDGSRWVPEAKCPKIGSPKQINDTSMVAPLSPVNVVRNSSTLFLDRFFPSGNRQVVSTNVGAIPPPQSRPLPASIQSGRAPSQPAPPNQVTARTVFIPITSPPPRVNPPQPQPPPPGPGSPFPIPLPQPTPIPQPPVSQVPSQPPIPINQLVPPPPVTSTSIMPSPLQPPRPPNPMPTLPGPTSPPPIPPTLPNPLPNPPNPAPPREPPKPPNGEAPVMTPKPPEPPMPSVPTPSKENNASSPKICPDINPPKFGFVTGTCVNATKDDICTHSCKSGYALIGFPNITCTEKLMWDMQAPICVKADCPALPPSDVPLVGATCSLSGGLNGLTLCIVDCKDNPMPVFCYNNKWIPPAPPKCSGSPVNQGGVPVNQGGIQPNQGGIPQNQGGIAPNQGTIQPNQGATPQGTQGLVPVPVVPNGPTGPGQGQIPVCIPQTG